MKLFHKIFLSFVVIFSIAFQIVGFLLINFAYENSIEQEKKFALQEFQYNKYILQSILYSAPEILSEIELGDLRVTRSFTVPIAIYGEDKKCIYTNMVIQPEISVLENVIDEKINYRIMQTKDKSNIYVYDSVFYNEGMYYLITKTDISNVVDTQRNMIKYFQKIYVIIILCIGFPVIFILTSLLTKTIKQVSKAAKRITDGNYDERIKVKGHDEIGELANNFNQMTEKVEEKIAQLSDNARQKEDFAANFAHELKTPLTSVIGYADMLYQKELPKEQVKCAAEYILNEGMRLEALSLKLMDLFVMDKQSFVMEKMFVKDIFGDLMQGIEPVCQKYKTRLHMAMDEGSIDVDYDLFKTMILNLIDNAVKADSDDIWISGKQSENIYQICIKDNSKGVPSEELGKITEAFYMIDKSRSRKQHGAGLGMALVAKVIEIHKAEMKIKSDGKTETVITIMFPVSKGGQDE